MPVEEASPRLLEILYRYRSRTWALFISRYRAQIEEYSIEIEFRTVTPDLLNCKSDWEGSSVWVTGSFQHSSSWMHAYYRIDHCVACDLRKLYHAIGFDIKESYIDYLKYIRSWDGIKNIKNVVNILNYSRLQNNSIFSYFPSTRAYKDWLHKVAVQDSSRIPA